MRHYTLFDGDFFDKKSLITKTIILSFLSSYFASVRANTNDVYFNPRLIETSEGLESIDLSYFERGNVIPAGIYNVGIKLNGQSLKSMEVEFVENNNGQLLFPVFLGTQIEQLPIDVKGQLVDDYQYDLTKLIPGSTFLFKPKSMELELFIPQALVKKLPRGYIDPTMWDQGIVAATFDYYAMGSKNNARNPEFNDTENYYANLRSGLNVGPWRLRNYTTFQKSNGMDEKFKNVQLYAQRDIQSIKSQLTLGEDFTSSDVIDSFGFTGVRLESDSAMLPESMRGFSPIIRGIAETNAHVTIKQGDIVVYETDVPAGPFVISDLYEAYKDTRLEVIIAESNGQTRRFFQNVAAVPIMEREGNLTYSLTAGAYRSTYDNDDAEEPGFGEATFAYGLPYSTTIYGGVLYSKDYQNGTLGIGKSLGILGALSFDATYMHADISEHSWLKYFGSEETIDSLRYRLRYLKNIDVTNTYFSLSWENYSNDNYFSFSNFNDSFFGNSENNSWNSYQMKNNIYANISQYLGKFGSFYLSAGETRYWNHDYKMRTYQAGYDYITPNSITFSTSYNYNQEYFTKNEYEDDHQVSVGVRIPFSIFNSPKNKSYNRTILGYQYVNSKNSDDYHNIYLSGSALKNNQLSYSIQDTIYNRKNEFNEKNNVNEVYGNVSYSGSKGTIGLNAGRNDNLTRYGYNISGGAVIHSGGVTLSPPLGETIALINTNKVKNVHVSNDGKVKTDMFGYAVLPYLTPYRENNVDLNLDDLGSNTNVTKGSQRVIPTRGAVVLANFEVVAGENVIINLLYGTKKLPFGTQVEIFQKDKKFADSIVDMDGNVFFSSLPKRGELIASWGAGQCRGTYELNNTDSLKTLDLRTIQVVCR